MQNILPGALLDCAIPYSCPYFRKSITFTLLNKLNQWKYFQRCQEKNNFSAIECK